MGADLRTKKPSSLTDTSPRRPRFELKKQVSFTDRSAQVYECPWQLERQSSWCDPRELKESAESQKQLVREYYRQDPYLSLDEIRGLEDFVTRQVYKETREKTQKLVALVLEEHHRQVEVGQVDPDRLRKKSRKVSKYCAESAYSLGKHDAKIARRLYRQEGSRNLMAKLLENESGQ